MSELLILGAGQYGHVVREIAQATGIYNEVAFLDDNSVDAIGSFDDLEKWNDKYKNAVVAIGKSDIRLGLIRKLLDLDYNVPMLIHPRAYVSPSAKLGLGCIVEAMSVINTEANVGEGCIISAGAIVNHNAVIGDGCHIDCGAVVGARATLSSGTKLKYNEVTQGQ